MLNIANIIVSGTGISIKWRHKIIYTPYFTNLFSSVTQYLVRYDPRLPFSVYCLHFMQKSLIQNNLHWSCLTSLLSWYWYSQKLFYFYLFLCNDMIKFHNTKLNYILWMTHSKFHMFYINMILNNVHRLLIYLNIYTLWFYYIIEKHIFCFTRFSRH